MATLNVPITSVVKNITLTVNVSGLRVWRWRVWLGLQLIQLAARVMGCGFRLEA